MRLKKFGVEQKKLAEAMGITPQNLNNKLSREWIKPELIEEIAKHSGLAVRILTMPIAIEPDEPTRVAGPNATYYTQVVKNTEDFPDSKFIDVGDGKYNMIVPLVHQYAPAGYLSGFADPEYLESLPKHSILINRYHKGKYVAFEVAGDSMDDGTKFSIPHGAIITGRLIEREYWLSKLHTNRFPYFIIVTDEGVIVKEVVEHYVKNGVLRCKSLNPDKELYPDPVIDLRDVRQLYNVIDVNMKFNNY